MYLRGGNQHAQLAPRALIWNPHNRQVSFEPPLGSYAIGCTKEQRAPAWKTARGLASTYCRAAQRFTRCAAPERTYCAVGTVCDPVRAGADSLTDEGVCTWWGDDPCERNPTDRPPPYVGVAPTAAAGADSLTEIGISDGIVLALCADSTGWFPPPVGTVAKPARAGADSLTAEGHNAARSVAVCAQPESTNAPIAPAANILLLNVFRFLMASPFVKRACHTRVPRVVGAPRRSVRRHKLREQCRAEYRPRAPSLLRSPYLVDPVARPVLT